MKRTRENSGKHSLEIIKTEIEHQEEALLLSCLSSRDEIWTERILPAFLDGKKKVTVVTTISPGNTTRNQLCVMQEYCICLAGGRMRGIKVETVGQLVL